MKDALGGYFNLTLLFVFILLVSGFISLSISYTKAYRVKNNVLTYLEKYEGNTSNTEMLTSINDYIKSVGYTASSEAINAAKSDGYTCPIYQGQAEGWCYKKGSTVNEQFTIDIVVFVNVDIPFINRIFANFQFFWMNGTTNVIPVME